MKIEYYKILKIDNVQGDASVASFENTDNIDEYVTRILNQCASESGDRRYKFDDSLTTARNIIQKLLVSDDIDNMSIQMGNRLAHIEQETNNKYEQLKGKIPLGVLLLSIVRFEELGLYKFLIIKCDYDTFIEANSGQKSSGLSLKNRIFKTFMLSFSHNAEINELTTITVTDSNKRMASYWVHDFLELKEFLSDKDNTINAFNLIRSKILKPLKTEAKRDFPVLYNSTLKYMRSEGPFNLDYYKDTIIGTYKPSENLDIQKLKDKVEQLKALQKFDITFNKIPDAINNQVGDKIKLSDELELYVKFNFAGMNSTILPYEKDGEKGIIILSAEGYEYAQGLKNYDDE